MKLFRKYFVALLLLLAVTMPLISSNGATYENKLLNQTVLRQNSQIINYADEKNIEEDIAENVKFSISRIAYSSSSVNFVLSLENDGNEVYCVGNQKEGIGSQPGYIEFSLLDDKGNKIDKKYEAVLFKNSGNNILNSNYSEKLEYECTTLIPALAQVDKDSVVLKNIYHCHEYHTEETGWEVEVLQEQSYFALPTYARKLLTPEFDSFIKITPKMVTEFSSYYALQLDVEHILDVETYIEMISVINPTFVKKDKNGKAPNVDDLRNGVSYINIQFTFTRALTYFNIIDNDGKEFSVEAYSSNKNLSFGLNNLSITIPSKGINGIKDLYIYKPLLSISVIKKDSNKEVPLSDFNYRFGLVSTHLSDVYDVNGNLYQPAVKIGYRNDNITTTLVTVISAVIIVAIGVALYLYRKVKYKNDEFKKLNVKAYIKTFIIAFLFGVAATLEAFFLTIRVTTFNNAENFANPMDVLVIVIGLLTFLLLCYFIRKYYIGFKENLEKRRREKLKLNDKQEDSSGTISTALDEIKINSDEEDEKPLTNYEIFPRLFVDIKDMKLFRIYQKEMKLLSMHLKLKYNCLDLYKIINHEKQDDEYRKAIDLVLDELHLEKLVKISDFAVLSV